MTGELQSYLVKKGVSVKNAMRQMSMTGEKVLFVVDDDDTLYGSLTDGDIRRWILSDGSLDENAAKICKKDPIYVTEKYELSEVKRLMTDRRIESVPVVDEAKRVSDVLLWDAVFGGEHKAAVKALTVPVVIMAGGKGTRLDPFTRILPKPLIPIGEKSIIEIIMDKFSRYGVNEFYVSVNHRAKMMKSYFEEIGTGHIIHYIEEQTPLGTAGSLKFLQGKIEGSLLVTNCDIIIDADYPEIVEFHDDNSYDMTIVGSFRHYKVPYGICEIENGGALTAIREKPEYDFLVNTGMYIVRADVLDLIPENQVFHITDLVKKLKNKRGRVGVFPLSEKSWIDIGQWEEYRKVARELGSGE